MSTRTRSEWCLLCVLLAVPARSQPELGGYRDRFRQGLVRYDANDVAGALSFWEPLFHDLGPQTGYRVGYNLARAYEVLGDATRAAERYESFLMEVKRRGQAGEVSEPEVQVDEQEAHVHLERLAQSRLRLHVPASSPPQSVRVDEKEPRLAGFVAYVAPGSHDVVFSPGSDHEHTEHVTGQAGELLDVAAPAASITAQPPPVQRQLLRTETHHPFSPLWLGLAGGATVAAGVLTGIAYASADNLYNQSLPRPTPQQRNDFSGARTLAYASWAGPSALGVLTVALFVWYFAATKQVRVPLTAALAF